MQRVFRDWKLINQLAKERAAPKPTLFRVRLLCDVPRYVECDMLAKNSTYDVIKVLYSPCGPYLRLRATGLPTWVKATDAKRI